jgi:hypothetical protein
MNRVFWATDAAYFRYTAVSMASFLHCNSGWLPTVLDVGLTPEQRERFGARATVVPAKRELARAGIYIPSAEARIELLACIASGDIVLYLDSDTIVTGSVDPLRDRFVNFGRAFGIIPNAARVGWPIWPMHQCWLDQQTPARHFPRYASWKNEPTRSTGVVIATCEIGAAARRALGLYQQVKHSLALAEQTILNSVLMEDGIPAHDLLPHEHCLVEEGLLAHPGVPYFQAPLLDGLPVIIRHFPGPHKRVLDKVFPSLEAHYRL